MSYPLERLTRLGQLHASGALSDAEFEAQKAAILADTRVSSDANQRRERKEIRLGLIAVAVLVLIAGAYLLARLHGTEDALSETAAGNAVVAASAPVPAADTPSPAATSGEISIAPPSDYLNRCIFTGFTPHGARLAEFADYAVKLGRGVSWQQNGADWILRMHWHDKLADTDHDEGIQFSHEAGASTPATCTGVSGDLKMERTVLDSVETQDLDDAFVPLFAQLPDANNQADPASTTSSPSMSKTLASANPALSPGRCKLVVGGASYIEGPCYYSLDKDGSFSIYDTPNGSGGYFATLERDGPSGTGYWNGSKGSTHAQDELGTMTRQGACWSGGGNQICLWS